MDAAAANAPRTLGAPGYEAWYVTVQQPDARRGFWLRYSTLRPSPGSNAEPHAGVWAISFDRDHPERNRAVKETHELGGLAFPAGGVQVAGSELGSDGCRGTVAGKQGGAEWELTWRRRSEPFAYLDPRFQFLSTVSNIAAAPSLEVSGRIAFGAEEHRLEAAPGTQQHTWGRSHALLQNWACAPGLGDDGAGWLAGATVRARSRLGRAVGGTALGLRLAGRSLDFNRPLQVLRTPGHVSAEGWRTDVRHGPLSVNVSVTPRRQDLIGVTYTDPDGSRRICYHTEVADLEITLSERGVPVGRAARSAACGFEYQSEGPLPGLPPRL